MHRFGLTCPCSPGRFPSKIGHYVTSTLLFLAWLSHRPDQCGVPFHDSHFHPPSHSNLPDSGLSAGLLAGCVCGDHPALLRVSRTHLVYLVFYGLLLALFNSLWTLSVALNGAAVATVLVYSSAGFTVLLGWWLLKESLGWVKILAVVLCLAGCALVAGVFNSGEWNASLIGIITGILAGLSYAFYSLMGRSASQRGLNPWSTLLYIFAFAAVFLLIINLLPLNFLPGKAQQPADLFWLKDAWAGWGVLFLLAAVPTVAGFGLLLVSLTLLPSSIANLIVTSEPVFTAVTAYFLLGERMNGLQIVGSLLILSGVVFLRIYEGWAEKNRARGGLAELAE
jgi:drug/metabolite transporter (DMT)-like permease